MTGTLTIGNLNDGPLPVRDPDNLARNGFQKQADCQLPAGVGVEHCTITIVPQNKILVIEFVSIRAVLPGGQLPAAEILIPNEVGSEFNVATEHFITLTAQGSFPGGDFYRASQPVRFYGKPGAIITLGVHRSATSSSAIFTVSISGYLVDAP